MLGADRIHRLTNGVVKFYVVEDGGRLTIVDAGAPGDRGLLERGMISIGRSFDALDSVVLTHAHSDHTGFVERARSQAAILFEGRNALVTGDVLSTRNPLTGRTGPQIAPDGLDHDSEQAVRSLDALEPIRADVLLPGHGGPWTRGTAEAIRLARAAGRS
jgi:glyoxylase-like metal-dependent hydrolase (beta-lactamase superfamily II)